MKCSPSPLHHLDSSILISGLHYGVDQDASNKIASCLQTIAAKKDLPILYTGKNGFIAHSASWMSGCKDIAGVTVDDIAKRLIDYGFHAPTMSWPVAITLMMNPQKVNPSAS